MLDSFRKSTGALPDAVVVLGSYGEIEWSNKVAHDFLGLKSPTTASVFRIWCATPCLSSI